MVGRSPSKLCNTWKRSLENFVPFCWNIRRGEDKKDKKKIYREGRYVCNRLLPNDGLSSYCELFDFTYFFFPVVKIQTLSEIVDAGFLLFFFL